VARLLRIDLNERTARVLAAFPRCGDDNRVFLSPAPSDQLLVAGSRCHQNKYQVIVVEPSRSGVRETLAFSGEGRLALEPTLTTGGLTVPVESAYGVVLEFLPDRELAYHRGGELGDCF
jgi:hypothetical protein